MDARRRFDVAALAGSCCWLALSVLVGTGRVSTVGPGYVPLAVGLAAGVLAPLTARLADLPFRSGTCSRWYRAASLSAVPGTPGVLASLALAPGPLAAALAIPWVVFSVSIGAFALRRGLPNCCRPPELAVSVALLSLPLAGLLLAGHRVGVTPVFEPSTALLAIGYVLYVGSALPAYVGVLGRVAPPLRAFPWLVGAVVTGPALAALVAPVSALGTLAVASAVAAAVVGVAVVTLLAAAPRNGLGEAMVVVAGLSLAVAGVALVGDFAVVTLGGGPDTVVPVGNGSTLAGDGSLIALVGNEAPSLGSFAGVESETPFGGRAVLPGRALLGAVAGALFGLVGWRLLDPAPTAPPLGVPISRLTARGRVGADYLERYDLVGAGEAGGMVDGFSAFDGPACESTRIAADVRAFYERTGEYDLRIEPTWEPGFRLGARLYGVIAGRVEQMNFPVDERDPDVLSSRIVPVDDRTDGRDDVRAWVRTYDETGAAIYVALYATHRLGETPYMNIAFPLPATNLTSVLRVEPLHAADPDGVRLSTGGDGDGDAGIYLRTPLGPLRIPMNETIRVWSGEMPDAFPDGFDDDGSDLYARHEITLFGRQFLRLDYRIDELREAT